MQASVVWSKGMSFTGTADSGHTVAIGTDPGVGGDDDGLRPMELMAISLAGCTAMDVISILRKKRVDVPELYDTDQYRPVIRQVQGKPMFLY